MILFRLGVVVLALGSPVAWAVEADYRTMLKPGEPPTDAAQVAYLLPWELELLSIQQRVVDRLAGEEVDQTVTGSIRPAQ